MVSIADVAQDAGVSSSTVSYVLSGKRSISPETRRRVEASIHRLGYHPHAGARALASSRTNVLALSMPLRTDIDVPVLMGFVTSVVTAARKYDYDVLLLTNDEGPEGLRRVANSAMADALLVMDVEVDDPRIPVSQSLSCPTVLIGLPDEPGDLSCVDLDFSAAAKRCVHHLADLGHEHIALVGPSPAVYERGTSFATRFLRGFTTVARERGLHASSQPCAPSYEGVRDCLDGILVEQPRVTGLVVHNEAALGTLLSELRNRDMRVPEDVSVVAVSPDEMAANWPIPLTTVPLPSDDIGVLAVEMAMRELEGVKSPEVRLLSPRLTTARSTAQRH
ncbi:LacI family transcriptional regulator [Actinopolyspora erythraea]|uniref:LacI family transcriptional regulator n=1 Tax=Actinopolyspora erythraea TaxID=414996 RepID=A0A099D7M9_9ACTN|nr:LacI family DNA-binding transcriptional regulator [Actinopolyspora erythraea]ASU78638.1 LacI family transcriptional regulator [Actinopolyspora erythraea]KGI81400.1 LacI family transcriptional regulator [Actinopolyspora erythraea]